MRHRRFLVTRAFSALALGVTLGADPAPTAKLVPTLVHAESVTITTAPLSANAPAKRSPLAIAATSVLTASQLAPASLAAGGTLTTASLTASAPGGVITTASLSAYSPGGTFTLPVVPLSAVAPKAGPSTRVIGVIASSSLATHVGPAVSGGATIVTDGLSATAPGGVVTTTLLAAFAPVVTGPPNGTRGPVIGPAGVRLSSAGANGGTLTTQALMATAPGSTIATLPLSASAPGGTFGILASPLAAGAPAPHSGVLSAVLLRPNLAPQLSSAESVSATIPTDPLMANAPGSVITTTQLTATAPHP